MQCAPEKGGGGDGGCHRAPVPMPSASCQPRVHAGRPGSPPARPARPAARRPPTPPLPGRPPAPAPAPRQGRGHAAQCVPAAGARWRPASSLRRAGPARGPSARPRPARRPAPAAAAPRSPRSGSRCLKPAPAPSNRRHARLCGTLLASRVRLTEGVPQLSAPTEVASGQRRVAQVAQHATRTRGQCSQLLVVDGGHMHVQSVRRVRPVLPACDGGDCAAATRGGARANLTAARATH